MSRGPYRTDTAPGLTGEAGLCAAVLRQAVDDAGGKRRDLVGRSAIPKIQHEAIAFLRDAPAVAEWIALTGADPELVYPRLLLEAGLEEQFHDTGI